MAYVPGEIKPINSAVGISKQPGHLKHRLRCIQKFDALFGDILKTSVGALMPSDKTEEWREVSINLPEKWRPIGSPWAEGKTYMGHV